VQRHGQPKNSITGGGAGEAEGAGRTRSTRGCRTVSPERCSQPSP
jgi:hypothetical protein